MEYIACNVESDGVEYKHSPSSNIWCVAFYTRAKNQRLKGWEGLHSKIKDWLFNGGGLCLTWDLYEKDILQLTKAINNSEHHRFVFHNAAYDVAHLRTKGGDISPGQYEDSQALAYCLFPSERTSLGSLSLQWLDRHKREQPPYDRMHEELYFFNLEQVDLTYHLWLKLYEEAKEWDNVLPFYYEVERPYIERIIEMEKCGSYINTDKLEEGIKEATLIHNKLYFELCKYVKSVPAKVEKGKQRTALAFKSMERFNPDSDEHLRYVFYQQYGLPVTKTTRSGKPSVDKYVLSDIAMKPGEAGELAKVLIEYNKWQTYRNTFLLSISSKLEQNKERNVHDGQPCTRIRTSFRQFEVNTGRLSSSKPNLQNIPARGDTGSAIRSMFTTPPKCQLLVGDLDRIELCVLAFYLESVLGYTALNDRIKNGEDVHQSNTDEWSAITGKELQRKTCKNGIFATIYGCGVKKFAQTVDVSLKDAKAIFAQSEIMQYVNKLRKILVQTCISQGGVLQNFFGRNLYIPAVLSHDPAMRAAGERKVFNYVIQSTAGDAFKIKQLEAVSVQIQYDLCQSLVVHDECLYIAPEPKEYVSCNVEEEYATYFNIVCEALSKCYTDNELLKAGDVWTPISCEFHWADNWLTAKGE